MADLRRHIVITVDDREFQQHRKDVKAFGVEGKRGFRGVKKGADEAAQTSGKVSGALARIGNAAKLWIAGVALAAFTAFSAAVYRGARSAVAFEAAMGGIRKTTGLTGRDLRALGGELLNLSSRLGAPQGELATIAQTAGQLGIRGVKDITAFTETVAKLVRVSDLSADEAASNIARIANIFDLPIAEAERLGSVLNELSNTTTATARDIAAALTRVGQAGSSLGLTVEQVAALSATLIDSGIDAERAGTSLRNVFIRLRTEAEKIGSVLGITGEEFATLVEQDALGALEQYLDALGKLPPQIQAIKIKDAFGDENFLAVQSLAAQTGILTKNLETSGEAFRAGTSLNTEHAVSMQNVAAQWDLFLAKAGAVATRLGSKALPVFESALETLNNLGRTTEEVAASFQAIEERLNALDQVERAVATFERLSSQQHLTTEETNELEQATSLLEDRFANYVAQTDAAGRATAFYTDRIRDAIKAQRAFNIATQQATFENLISRYKEAERSLRIARTQQEQLNAAIEETGPLLDQALSKGFAGSRDAARLSNELDFFIDRMERAGGTAQTAEARIRENTNAIIGLFQTSEGVDFAGLTDALTTTGRSFEEAKRLSDELRASWIRLNDLNIVGPTFDDFVQPPAPPEETQAPPAPPVDPEKLKASRDALEAILRMQELIASATEDEKEALEQVFRIQDEIRDLKEIEATLGRKATKEALANAEARLQKAQQELAKYKELGQAIKEAAESLDKIAARPVESAPSFIPENADEAVRRITRSLEQYREELTQLENQLSAGIISEEEFFARADEAARSLTEQIRRLYTIVQSLGLLTPEVEAAFRALFNAIEEGGRHAGQSVSEAADELEKAAEKMRLFAGGFDGLSRVADAFGMISDSVRTIIRGAASAFNALARIQAGRAAILRIEKQIAEAKKEQNEAEEASARNALQRAKSDQVLGQLGLAVGIFTTIHSAMQSYADAITAKRDEERRQREAHIQALRDLNKALRDYQRALEDSIESNFSGGRVGSGLTRENIGQGLGAIDALGAIDFRGEDREIPDDAETGRGGVRRGGGDQVRPGRGGGGSRSGGPGGAAPPIDEDRILELVDQIDRSGIFDFDVNAYFQALLEKYEGDYRLALEEFLSGEAQRGHERTRDDFGGVANAAQNLEEHFGELTHDLAGAMEGFRIMRDFLGVDLQQAFNNFIDFLLENVEGLAPELRTLLEEARGLDLSTEEGRKRLREIIATIAENFPAFLGEGFTEEDLNRLLEFLDSVATEAAQGGDEGFTRSVQIGRTITEIQANELLALTESILFTLQQIRFLMGGDAPGRTGTRPEEPGSSGDGASGFEGVPVALPEEPSSSPVRVPPIDVPPRVTAAISAAQVATQGAPTIDGVSVGQFNFTYSPNIPADLIGDELHRRMLTELDREIYRLRNAKPR